MSTGWRNRRTLAWAGYDIAGSVYFGVAPAVLLPIYFQSLMADLSNPTAAWGALAAGAILVSGVAALLAAALAARIERFRLLAAFTCGLVAALVVLAWNPGGSLWLAAGAYVAAQSCYFAATTIYESYLPDLLPPGLRQRLSGFGWAIGYLGGLLAIALLLLQVAGQPESEVLLAACFGLLAMVSAVFFAVALWLMGRAGFPEFGRSGAAPRLLDVVQVLRQWRGYRPIFRLLAGAIAVQAGISVAVVITAPVLAARFGQSLYGLLWLLALLHVLSVPSTLLWNSWIERRSRVVPMLLLLLLWGAVLMMLAFGSGTWMPVAIVSVIGCCLGATQSAVRGFLAEAVPDGGGPAFFALFTATGRGAAALGPALFALITARANEQAALVAVLALMAAGSVLVLQHLRKPQAT